MQMHSANTKHENNIDPHNKKNNTVKNNSNNKNQNKLLLCFRPVVMDDLAVGQGLETGRGHRQGDPVFNYVKLEHKDGVRFPQIIPATTSPISSEKGSNINVYPEKKSHKRLSRLLKVVLFETSLGFAKNIKKRKLSQKLNQSKGSLSSPKVEKDSNSKENNSVNSTNQEFPKKDEGRNIDNLRSSNSSLRPSSSLSLSSHLRSSSETNQSFRSNPIESKLQRQDDVQASGKRHHSSNIGLFLLLVSLVVLVFWGRVCAIFCTSILLFFIPHCLKTRKPQDIVDCQRIIDSDEYKKKVIMEGLLERNRSRVY